MCPKSEPKQVERELFQSELEQIIDLNHPLVRLGTRLDWDSLESALGATYHPTQGAPGTPTRLMVALNDFGEAICQHIMPFRPFLRNDGLCHTTEAFSVSGISGLHERDEEVTASHWTLRCRSSSAFQPPPQ